MPQVLIVDNDPIYLDALRLYLSDLNHDWEIITAANETEGVSILEAKEIDLVLTDLVMLSEQGGMELLRFAKQKDPLVMTILYTGRDEKLDRYKAFEIGAFDCILRTAPGIKMGEEMNVKARAALQFRALAQELIREQQRIEFLKRYFDPHVFEKIEQNKSMLDLQTRTVTICFWDIRGFSKFCETLKAQPSLIAGFLKEYFQLASETIFSLDGVLDKFIGDGVMALFGAFGDGDDEGRQDAENAVNCALAIRHKFDAVQNKWLDVWASSEPHQIDIGLGCGIHTGVKTLVGNVGTDLRDQYTALGPHVNLAARLESMAQKGQILVSSTCEWRVRGKFLLNRIKTINDVKNIPGEFTIYEIAR
jgi:class 3 adenylate cyclase/CheY-like chemotaxis protein